MVAKSKVFGIGFHKTGTSSLANALYVLGYNVTGYFGVHNPDIKDTVFDEAHVLAYRYDAAQDTPWPVLYKELDQWFPGSKFILTVRESDPWVRSVRKHFKKHRIQAHEWIYGVSTAIGNESAYIRRYEKHNREVKEYFKNRPNDFLVMDITGGDGWELLCPFLGVEIPPFNFPAQNLSTEKSRHFTHSLIRYINRKIDPVNYSLEQNHVALGVTSAFLRDILHYHLSIIDLLWKGVNQINEVQYVHRDLDQENSVRDYMLRQAYEEYVWYQLLTGESELPDFSTFSENYPYRNDLFRFWKQICFLLRRHAANLTDRDCNIKIPNRIEIVWEVYLHLMNSGTQHSVEIRRRLQDLGVQVDVKTVIDFFYSDIQQSPLNQTLPREP